MVSRTPRPGTHSSFLQDSVLVSVDRNQINRELLVAALGDEWPADLIQTAAEMLADSESRFPSGPRRLPGDLVRAIQRERLLVGMLRAVSELGYRVDQRPGRDRAGGRLAADLLRALLEQRRLLPRRLRHLGGAPARPGRDSRGRRAATVWRDRLRLGFDALLAFADAEPEAARVVIVEARAATPDAALRRVALIDDFATCIDTKVRELLPAGTTHSAVTASGVVGGVESMLYGRLNKGQMDDLPALLPSLMYFAVLPYEGHLAASEELGLKST